MKFLRLSFLLGLIALQIVPAFAFWHGSQTVVVSTALTQTGFGGTASLLNVLKSGQDWVCNTGSAHYQPSDVDVNGYPQSTAACLTGGGTGYNVPNIGTPSQFERPGDWVFLGAGIGQTFVFDASSSGSTSPGASGCSGVRSSAGNLSCNNSTCTQPVGSISGQTLTITSAGSCALLLYEPITNASTFTSPPGVPTMIIGMSGSSNCPSCTGTGAAGANTGTYLVNWSQSVGSGSLIPGMYNEASVPASSETTTGSASWEVEIQATDATNPLHAMALVHKNDLLLYAQGQWTSVLQKQRTQQANFAYQRDLSFSPANQGNITTWATRKPVGYYSYGANEQRASLYACSYGAYNGTLPCTTGYALNGSSNDYSVNLGASLPVDKQTVCFQFSTTTTGSTNTFSIDNGVTKFPLLLYHGSNGGASNFVANHVGGVVFDAAIGAWFSNVQSGASQGCLLNGGPPEAFIAINQEMGTTPYIVEPYLAADPITDYMAQYATLLTNYTWPHQPILSAPDEPWNCAGQGIGVYVSQKSAKYTSVDAAWAAHASGHASCATGGDNINWTAKAGSLLGQVVRNISNSYILTIGAQTVQNGSISSSGDMLLTQSYVGQNPADIPIQSGCAGPGAIQTNCPAPFTQATSYNAMKGATSLAAGVEIANYWTLALQGNGQSNITQEVALAFCYFQQAAGCASQSSIMATYMATAGDLSSLWLSWYNFGQNCAGSSACQVSVYNYEGQYGPNALGADQTSPVTGATNAATAVLSVSPNGCVAGQTVGLSALTGGTWSTAAGSYTVQSATGATCTINLNSTSLGTLSTATLTYTGSLNYVNWLRSQSYYSAQMGPTALTQLQRVASTTSNSACFPNQCSYFPSALGLAGNFYASSPWFLWTPDLYGYSQVASCSACTETGGNMTLGGTLQGIFASGQTIVGGGISGATITGACSQTGANPAGANVGDVCPISSASTVTAHAMTGTIAPSLNGVGNSTTSPVLEWNATCAFSSNGNQC